VAAWEQPSATVTGHADANFAVHVADPRMGCEPRNTVLGVVAGDQPAGTVLGAAQHDNGAFSVADPRVQCERNEGGHGVLGWHQAAPTVIGHASIHNWPAAAADPRFAGLEIGRVVQAATGLVVVGVTLDLDKKGPLKNPPIILALDGTWHRPMTTLELAALQSIPVRAPDGSWLVLDGGSHERWREQIGNAVPVDTATAIAGTALSCLLSSDANEVSLSSEAIWVEQPREVSA
jgi:hypothetical protein